ncbi:MAG: hypothetical protein ACI37Z_05175 [Candidatus Gastranaerophilaceae bacterium]
MENIFVKTQEELDMIPVDLEKRIVINSEYCDIIIIRKKYVCPILIRKNSRVTVFNDAHVIAAEHSCVEAYNESIVWAKNDAYVEAYDKVQVIARDNSEVYACNLASVIAFAKSRIHAYDKAFVFVWDNASVDAFENSNVVARDFAFVKLENHATVYAQNFSTIKYLNGFVFAQDCARIINMQPRNNTNKITLFDGAQLLNVPDDLQKNARYNNISIANNKVHGYMPAQRTDKPGIYKVLIEDKTFALNDVLSHASVTGLLQTVQEIITYKLKNPYIQDFAILEVEAELSEPDCTSHKSLTVKNCKVLKEVKPTPEFIETELENWLNQK